MEDFLDFSIATPVQEVTVSEVKKTQMQFEDGEKVEKVRMIVKDSHGRTFGISDAWVDRGSPVIKGMWLSLINDKQLAPGSTIASILRYYSVDNFKELIGKKVKIIPDNNNFFVLVACDLKKEE